MIREKIQKSNEQQFKETLKGYLKTIEKAQKLEKEGDKEAADKMFNDIQDDVKKQIERIKGELNETEKGQRDFDRSMLPADGQVLGEQNKCRLVAFDENYRELFLNTEKSNSVMPHMYEKEDFRDIMWKDCLADTGLYYAIHNEKNEYIGYVAIKDTRKPTWEVAIVLLPDYRYKGYGKTALMILFDELYKRNGERLFRARVNSDNYASQTLFKKLGARTNGISEFMLHGDALEEFQKENLDMIDEKLESVAEEFGVDAEDLLGHVLEYLIDWPQDIM